MRKKTVKKKKGKTNNIDSDDKQKYIKELLNFNKEDEDEKKMLKMIAKMKTFQIQKKILKILFQTNRKPLKLKENPA